MDSCETWKKEFTNAAKRKLSGERSDDIEIVINKATPCDVVTAVEYIKEIVRSYNSEKKK